METRADLEKLCSELNLAIIVIRDPYHGWHAKIKSGMQMNPLITGQGDGMEGAMEHLMTRAFRVIEEFRPRIERFNKDQAERRRRQERSMGLR